MKGKLKNDLVHVTLIRMRKIYFLFIIRFVYFSTYHILPFIVVNLYNYCFSLWSIMLRFNPKTYFSLAGYGTQYGCFAALSYSLPYPIHTQSRNGFQRNLYCLILKDGARNVCIFDGRRRPKICPWLLCAIFTIAHLTEFIGTQHIVIKAWTHTHTHHLARSQPYQIHYHRRETKKNRFLTISTVRFAQIHMHKYFCELGKLKAADRTKTIRSFGWISSCVHIKWVESVETKIVFNRISCVNTFIFEAT